MDAIFQKKTPVTTQWLPRPTQSQRLRHFRALPNSHPRQKPIARFSEFLAPENIGLFYGDETKIQVVEALVRTLRLQKPEAALQAIWSREREGALGIPKDISILRGRLEGVHHLRTALGLCPKGVLDPSNPQGMTRIFVVLIGPATQTRLHAGILVAISALLHNRRFVEQLLRLQSSARVLQALHETEGVAAKVNLVQRVSYHLRNFLLNRYGWGPALY